MKKKRRIALVMAIGAVTACTLAGVVASVSQTPTQSLEVVQTAILRQGSSGSEVKEMQQKLKRWGYYTGSVDGVYGAATKKAVIAFQKKNGLTADGVVGAATYKALGMTNSYNALQNQSSSSSGGYSNADVYLLARTIYAEGRGEPYTGQVAIGAVVLAAITVGAVLVIKKKKATKV